MPITSVRLARSCTVSPRRYRHAGLAAEGATVSGRSTAPCCPTGAASRDRDGGGDTDDGGDRAQQRPAVQDDRDRGGDARYPQDRGGEERGRDGGGSADDA